MHPPTLHCGSSSAPPVSPESGTMTRPRGGVTIIENHRVVGDRTLTTGQRGHGYHRWRACDGRDSAGAPAE